MQPYSKEIFKRCKGNDRNFKVNKTGFIRSFMKLLSAVLAAGIYPALSGIHVIAAGSPERKTGERNGFCPCGFYCLL